MKEKIKACQLIIIFCLTLSAQVFANHLLPIPGRKPKVIPIRSKVIKGKKSHFCLKEISTADEILNAVRTMGGTELPLVSDKINGVEFTDESPVLLEAFRNLTTAKNSLGSRLNPESQIDIQEAYEVNPICNKVECAVMKIWGSDMGPKILYLLLKQNLNTSELAFEKSSRLKPDELDDIFLATEDFPKEYYPLGRLNSRFNHFTRNEYFRGDKTIYAITLVAFFDSWSKQPRNDRREVVFHELAHISARNVKTADEIVDNSAKWMGLSGWERDGKFDWKHSASACFVTSYAGDANAWEDWAESMRMYRYNPNTFKSKCPDKYNFIKEVIYQNREFTSAESCAENSIEQNGQIEEIGLMSPESLDD